MVLMGRLNLVLLLTAVLAASQLSGTISAANCQYQQFPGLGSSLTANQPWYCQINAQIYNEWSPYVPLAVIAVLLAFIIAAIIIMAGMVAHSQVVRNFGIGELYEAVASAIIVGLFIYLTAVLFGVTPGVAVPVGINPYVTALHIINQTINTSQTVYGTLYGIYITSSLEASISVAPQYPGESLLPSIGSFINAAIQVTLDVTEIEPSQVIAGLLSDAMLALWSEYYLIIFFSIVSIPVFIIPGVIFRTILPLRPFGGMLIALGIGFYLIMPFLFAVATNFTGSTLNSALLTYNSQLSNSGAGSGAISNANGASSPIAIELSGLQSAMSGYWLMVLFFPVLIIALTYSFVTQVATFIGGISYAGNKLRTFV